jgi:hypothetical protein
MPVTRTIMADIKFACPHCAQHITCDELWGGHQLDCPSCKNPLSVPAAPAPQAGPGESTGNPLVPKPPVEARLSIGGAHATAAASTAQRTIPIRNLVPPPPKKKNALVKYSILAAVLVLLGVGVYFAYPWISGMQNKVNEASKDAAKNADGGQVAHIAKLNAALNATEPGRAPADSRTADPRQRRSGAGQEIPMSGGNDAGAAATNALDNAPLIPAVWTLDITKARIPSGRVNGAISGTNFVAESARVDPVGTAQVLRLLQGQAISPDREVLIYLHLKAGEKLGGQTLNISQEMAGVGVPQVTKRWKNNPKYAPLYKSFTSGYALRLELGQVADGSLPGKIFLALPDPDQSVVAGSFAASITTNVVVDATVQAAPAMAPAQTRAVDATFEARYGVRRP